MSGRLLFLGGHAAFARNKFNSTPVVFRYIPVPTAKNTRKKGRFFAASTNEHAYKFFIGHALRDGCQVAEKKYGQLTDRKKLRGDDDENNKDRERMLRSNYTLEELRKLENNGWSAYFRLILLENKNIYLFYRFN